MRSTPLLLAALLLLASAPALAQTPPAVEPVRIDDSDKDGVPDVPPGQEMAPPCNPDRMEACADNCPHAPNPSQDDSDGDGRGNACDFCPKDAVKDGEHADADNDEVGDECDNCPDYNPRDESGEQTPCPEPETRPGKTGPNPKLRVQRLQFFIRPLALGYRYQGSWVGSTGLGLHLGGSLGEWRFDEQGTAVRMPGLYWTAGVYADSVNVFAAEHLGPYAALDWRPMGWAPYARSGLRHFKFGLGTHLLWSKRVEGVENRPLHLGAGLRGGFLDIVSVMPFMQWDLANAAAFSWGGMLVFDFKVLADLGVPLVK